MNYKKFIIKNLIKLKNNFMNLKLGKIEDWLPLLAGPLIVLLVYFSYYINPTPSCWVGNKSRLEMLALWFTSIAVFVYLIRALTSKKPVFIMLTALAAAFLCREIHFTGTSAGIYVALVIIGFCGVLWQDDVFKNLEDGKLLQWLVATFSVYFLSQLVARRVFRFMPLEHDLHVAFEEVLESGAHIMLIITAFSDFFGKWRAKEKDVALKAEL